ncbi:MAG: hypothetical protein L3J59_09040 [Methylococcaceae bacterium]|nr:hypothetical protein [Methylococcaceae bacterium]
MSKNWFVHRVVEICSLLAHFHPSMSKEDADTLFHASSMHIIGKITVPYKSLHKPGKYTEDEFEVIKIHSSSAYKLLSGSKCRLIKTVTIIAHEHHEKRNVSGYLRQLYFTPSRMQNLYPWANSYLSRCI